MDDDAGKGTRCDFRSENRKGNAMVEPDLFEEVSSRLPSGRLFRVSRPGHSDRDACPVDERAVAAWVEGVDAHLTGAGVDAHERLAYVCLLGVKGSRREIADYYGVPRSDEVGAFQALLDAHARRPRFEVQSFPTEDHVPVADPAAIAAHVRELLLAGRTVLVGCSAAVERTGTVLRALAAGVQASRFAG